MSAQLQDIERLIDLGDVAYAEARLVVLWPDAKRASAEANYVWGRLREAQNRDPDAERHFRLSLGTAPAARTHFALGRLLARHGYAGQAAECFAQTLALDPEHAGARVAFAHAALDAGRAAEAEQAAREALQYDKSDDAWDALCRTLLAQDRPEEALAAAEEALRLDATSRAGLFNRAAALGALGRAEEALADLDTLAARGVQARVLWLARGAAYTSLGRDADAEATYVEALKRRPFDAELQAALANTRWMRGQGEFFTRDYEAAVAQAADALALRLGCADLMRRAGFTEKAEKLLRDGVSRAPDNVNLLTLLAATVNDQGRCDEGLPLLQRAIARAPNADAARAELVSTLLRLGRADEALREITPMREAKPHDQEWIAHETLAFRQLGDLRYRELCDYDAVVQPFDLAPPAGFRTSAAFNEALRERLMALHTFQAHPLEHSSRMGSQTTRDLTHVDDPIIQAYLAALNDPIRAYIEKLRGHPLTARDTGAHKLAGAWSIRLKPNGFHVNHVHPAGWISSAYYVALPEAVTSGADQQGWIKFGEPRWPMPGCTVEKVVQPHVGRLVLFPSYLWHGTIPFAAGERLTAPFDVVPA